MQVLVILVALLGLIPPAATSQVSTGTVAGCISDTAGGALPGVTVTVTASGMTLNAVSDAKGCFVVSSVPAGGAVMEAALEGFKTERRDDIKVKPGGELRLRLSMCEGGKSEIDWIFQGGTYAEHLAHADAVLHVRITSTVPYRPDCQESSWVHTATILDSVKAPANLARDSSISFVQDRWMQEQTPYPVATELVLSLVARPSGGFARQTGPHGVFVVKDGTVHGYLPPSFGVSYEGMALEAYLGELARLLK